MAVLTDTWKPPKKVRQPWSPFPLLDVECYIPMTVPQLHDSVNMISISSITRFNPGMSHWKWNLFLGQNWRPFCLKKVRKLLALLLSRLFSLRKLIQVQEIRYYLLSISRERYWGNSSWAAFQPTTSRLDRQSLKARNGHIMGNYVNNVKNGNS